LSPLKKPLPVTVRVVPPLHGPLLGLTLVIVGVDEAVVFKRTMTSLALDPGHGSK
jgi:hypothetical protein